MVEFEPIGVVHSPLAKRAAAPSHGVKGDVSGRIEVDPAYETALQGLEVGHRIDVVWHAVAASRDLLELDKVPGRGVFNSRSPDRPNPIAITPCTITAIDETTLYVDGLDMIDGTPVLDIKAPLSRDLRKT